MTYECSSDDSEKRFWIEARQLCYLQNAVHAADDVGQPFTAAGLDFRRRPPAVINFGQLVAHGGPVDFIIAHFRAQLQLLGVAFDVDFNDARPQNAKATAPNRHTPESA